MLRVWREFTDDIASSNAGLRDSSVEHHISRAIFQSELFIPLSLFRDPYLRRNGHKIKYPITINNRHILCVNFFYAAAGRRDIKTAARGSREHQR